MEVTQLMKRSQDLGFIRISLLGIPLNNKKAFLRFGEFHKMEDVKITEMFLYLGLVESIIALSLWPLSVSNSYKVVFQGLPPITV